MKILSVAICDPMPPKSKIVKRLERLINQIPRLEKEERLPYSGKYDLWKRRVELFLRRACSNEIVEEFKSIIKEEPSRFSMGSFLGTAEQLELQRIRERNYCRLALYRTKNLLTAIKEDIKLFELDEKTKKEAKKIKRKFEIEGGIPGILKGKISKEVEDT